MKAQLTLIVLLISGSIVFAQKVMPGDPSQNEIYYYCPPCGCSNDSDHFDTMGSCPSCNMELRPRYDGIEPSVVNRRLTVGILLFNGADIMDVTGPWSVFTHNGLQVLTFAKTLDPVTIGMSMELKPEFTLKTLPKVDVLVFPGSGLAETNPGDESIQKFINENADSTEVMFSVCSGAFFFGEAGLLDGKEATTIAGLIPLLKENYPKANVLNNVKFTDNGKVVTSAGLSSGIDAAFHVVSKFRGEGRAQDIANHMEYPWNKKTDYARSQLADNYALGIKNIISLFSKDYYYSTGDNNHWEYRYILTEKIEPEKILKLINEELEKTGKWNKIMIKNHLLKGRLKNDILGEGHIEFVAVSEIERNHLIIKVKRLKKYES